MNAFRVIFGGGRVSIRAELSHALDSISTLYIRSIGFVLAILDNLSSIRFRPIDLRGISRSSTAHIA